VHDIKGENWELTSGWRSTFSHCLLFNPTDPRSARYNPSLEVRKGAAEVRDVQNIADILVDPEGALERRTHWEKTSHSLLVGVILHVLYAEQQKTLTRVTEILADPSQSFEKTLRIMLATNHLGTEAQPKVHPVVAATARELLNKSENERSGVLSTAVSFLGLYRDPIVSRNTESCDWRIADLVRADKPVTLYLVVPPSDISRTKPLIRLILNQIGRRLTETLNAKAGDRMHRQLLMMLDEFPALGRLDFFESALAFMAGYGIRAYVIAQSLNQIAKAYGENNAILDNCHVRIAFAANDERTAKRISDALGTATELRAQRNYAGHRLAPWLGHVMVSRQETARPLLTPGEVMQLPSDQAIVLVWGLAPIRALKLRHYEDANFVARLRPPPLLAGNEYLDRPVARPDDWGGETRAVDLRLATLPYRELMQAGAEEGGLTQQLPLFEEAPPPAHDVRSAEERLLEDETDPAADSNQMQRAASASSTVRRAHAVTRDDDDLLPAF
jgi:type IV secretion system protein VirD4